MTTKNDLFVCGVTSVFNTSLSRDALNSGMEFHKDKNGQYLPLLPRGDPNKPRAKPRYSVANMPEEDVRKQRQVMMNSQEEEEGKKEKRKSVGLH